jgi:hypothetical protein
MRFSNYLLTFFFLTSLVVFFGCSGVQPIIPDNPAGDQIASNTSRAEFDSTQQLFGLYQVDVNTNDMTATIEPIRAASSNDTLESVDITGFLTSTPCKNCVIISGVGITSEGYLVLDMGIKHPFGAPDLAQPATPKNRADLHVFNVEGIVISDQPRVANFPALSLSAATGNLVNPDGFTANLDQFLDNIVPSTSNVHPYILHFDDYSTGNFSASNPNGFADLTNPIGNLVMKMGSDYSIKQYQFELVPGEPVSFAFAVGCTYGFTAADCTQRLNPEYRLPQHNKKAASEIHTTVIASNLERGDKTSVATLRIEVMDINHSATAGGNSDQTLFQSKVSSISAYAPTMGNEVVLTNPTPISGDGRNTPLVYEITITNTKNGPIGNNPCLIKVQDSYPVSMNPNAALGGADIMGRTDGTHSSLGYITSMATYQYIDLYVEPCGSKFFRPGVAPLDIGVDGQGFALIAYDDNQVWRYDNDYCSGEFFYTVLFPDAGELLRIDAHEDGRSMTLGDGCGG